MSVLMVRRLAFAVSGVWLLARAITHHTRRRASRVRRYAARPVAPAPVRPVALILPSTTTGRHAPPLPTRPTLPWEAAELAPVPVDVMRTDRSRLGVAVLLELAEEHPRVAA